MFRVVLSGCFCGHGDCVPCNGLNKAHRLLCTCQFPTTVYSDCLPCNGLNKAHRLLCTCQFPTTVYSDCLPYNGLNKARRLLCTREFPTTTCCSSGGRSFKKEKKKKGFVLFVDVSENAWSEETSPCEISVCGRLKPIYTSFRSLAGQPVKRATCMTLPT